ncbi:MAG: hypothetical protein LQ343_006273 [Gyalolechia ehrenbergii]|nr:MAG: hypothetical protein LQ343_006273 [Gyalolechia ehrenbergii]
MPYNIHRVESGSSGPRGSRDFGPQGRQDAPCQTSHWPLHKKTCTSSKKYNCFLLRAHPPNTNATSPFDNIADCVEPFHLQGYGTESAEINEFKQRLGWTSAYEMGKFYDHLGTDSWYYFVYGQTKAKNEGKPRNTVAARLCSTTPYGDVAIIRSGPANTYTPETFTKATLVKTL